MNGSNEIHSLESCKIALIREYTPYFSKSGRQWFDESLEALATSSQVGEDLGLYSAMAKRKLGTDKLRQANAIDTEFAPVDIRHWTSAEAARLILLMTAIESNPAEMESIINTYYRMGDEPEQMALLRGIIFFAPAEFLSVIALDAGRTNNLELLAALTLDNPYPAFFFNQQQFNQMVLKALFLGLAIERIQDLNRRANPDLARMGENYVVEREEAGRSVPVDIWLAIGPCASETGRQQMLNYLEHEDLGHRYYCTLGFIQGLVKDPSLLAILRQRLETEREPQVLELLQGALGS